MRSNGNYIFRLYHGRYLNNCFALYVGKRLVITQGVMATDKSEHYLKDIAKNTADIVKELKKSKAKKNSQSKEAG